MKLINAGLASALLTFQTFTMAANFLGPNELLQRGQYIQSSNQQYALHMQVDGSLVMYRKDGTIRYKMEKYGEFAAMQGDGNFVEYTKFNSAIWNTGTAGNPNATLQIQDDGNLVVYRADWVPLWNIGSEPSQNDPSKAGDVVGRDMDSGGAGPLGHVGLWDGSQVVEATREATNTVRLSSLNAFKGTVPAGYWGKASANIPSGLINARCYSTYCPTQGTSHEIVEARVAAAKLAFQAYLLGADYTYAASYVMPQYADQNRPAQRGVFRCDTFVLFALEGTTSYKAYPKTTAQNLWNQQFFSMYNYNVTPRNLHDRLKTFQ